MSTSRVRAVVMAKLKRLLCTSRKTTASGERSVATVAPQYGSVVSYETKGHMRHSPLARKSSGSFLTRSSRAFSRVYSAIMSERLTISKSRFPPANLSSGMCLVSFRRFRSDGRAPGHSGTSGRTTQASFWSSSASAFDEMISASSCCSTSGKY